MKLYLLLLLLLSGLSAQTRSPAIPRSDPFYRQLDFWIGEWDVYGPKGNQAGESKISLMLDSCVILEEWTSRVKPGAFVYKGKSFNTYNALERQWQQTWVDNAGSSTHYIFGKYENNRMVF